MPSPVTLLLGLSLAAVVAGVHLHDDLLGDELWPWDQAPTWPWSQGALKPPPAQPPSPRPPPAQQPSRGEFASTCKPYPGKRVVMVSVNKEFMDLFTNWLYFATRFLHSTEHLAVFAEDTQVLGDIRRELAKRDFEYSIFHPPHANASLAREATPDNTSGFARGPPHLIFSEAPWGSEEYATIVWRRPHYMLQLLRKGCTVLYADIDSVWAKDPFLDIGEKPGYPMVLISDWPKPQACPGYACSCFMYLQPTEEVKDVLKLWCTYHKPGVPNNQGGLQQALAKLKPNATCLPRERYPIGMQVDWHPNRTVVHANYIVGHDSKACFLSKHRMWKEHPIKKNCTIEWTTR